MKMAETAWNADLRSAPRSEGPERRTAPGQDGVARRRRAVLPVQQARLRPPEAGGADRRSAFQAVPVIRRDRIVSATGPRGSCCRLSGCQFAGQAVRPEIEEGGETALPGRDARPFGLWIAHGPHHVVVREDVQYAKNRRFTFLDL